MANVVKNQICLKTTCQVCDDTLKMYNRSTVNSCESTANCFQKYGGLTSSISRIPRYSLVLVFIMILLVLGN